MEVYENAPDMFCSVDLETDEVTACNATCAEKLGVEKEQFIGLRELEFYHPDSQPKMAEAFERLRETGRIENLEAQMVRSDGSVFDVSLSATAIEEDGQLVASRSVLRDFSDLKDTERKLRRRSERLQQSKEELEQFAYLASHDFQEPLRMVAGYTQLLERRYGSEFDEKVKK